jgi:hypothetical protein
MVIIARAEQTPPAGACFHEHSISTGIRTAVGYAMLNDMDVDSGPKTSCFLAPHLPSASHDLLDAEIESLGILSMKKGGCNPNLICNFYGSLNRDRSHKTPPETRLYHVYV